MAGYGESSELNLFGAMLLDGVPVKLPLSPWVDVHQTMADAPRMAACATGVGMARIAAGVIARSTARATAGATRCMPRAACGAGGRGSANALCGVGGGARTAP